MTPERFKVEPAPRPVINISPLNTDSLVPLPESTEKILDALSKSIWSAVILIIPPSANPVELVEMVPPSRRRLAMLVKVMEPAAPSVSVVLVISESVMVTKSKSMMFIPPASEGGWCWLR